MEWIDRLAQALEMPPLTPEESRALLDLARDVAHGVERRVTPLSTFLLGLAVGASVGAGPRDAALARASASLRATLPEAGAAAAIPRVDGPE